MKVTADTNVLVRVLTDDDPKQAAAARRCLSAAERIAVPIPVLCELVWVLRRAYRRETADIAAAIRTLLESAKIETDMAAAEAGLAVLEAGGDFTDGAIASQGQALGGETFVSFDRHAVAHLRAAGLSAEIPA